MMTALLALLCNVLPCLAVYDPADIRLANAEFAGELRLRVPAEPSSNFADVILCQNPTKHFAFSLPTLGQLVSDVVMVCSQKQMLVIDAEPIVAAMKDVASCWNWSNEQFVGDAVREWPAESSISSIVFATSPEDTTSRRLSPDIFCEAFCQISGLSSSLLANPRAEVSLTGGNLARDGIEQKFIAAQFARSSFVLIEISHKPQFIAER